MSIGEAATQRDFCCAGVAVSMGEAAKLRVFCCADVAVSMGEAAQLRVFCCTEVAEVGWKGKIVKCEIVNARVDMPKCARRHAKITARDAKK